MSPDLEKYRHLAKAEGNEDYSDEDLLRLWAAMQHLVTRAMTQRCPQLLVKSTVNKLPEATRNALNSTQDDIGEEVSP